MINTRQAVDWLKQFNEGQMTEIMWGLEDGVDVALYADPKLDKWSMREIRWRLNRAKRKGRGDDLSDLYESLNSK